MHPVEYARSPRVSVWRGTRGGDPAQMRNAQGVAPRKRPAAARTVPHVARRLVDDIQDGAWRERRAFLVGGGPSLAGFDWSLLRGELTIGINRAFEKFDPTIIYSMDARFWGWLEKGVFGPESLERWRAYDGIRCWLDTATFPYPPEISVVPYVGMDEWGESLETGIGGGRNSGYGALNLAVLLGADPIYLLGYDMGGGGDGKQAWWHDGYPSVQEESVYWKMIDAFRAIADKARARARIVNLNPDSNLRCFEFGDVSSLERIDRPVVVSYYTAGTRYAEEAKRLVASLRRFGLERDVVEVPNLGSWQANTSHKPAFLLKMLEAHPGRSLLWLDADAVVARYPERLDNFAARKADVAVHYRRDRELLSGTIWLANNETTRALCRAWAAQCRLSPERWDQRVLQAILDVWDGRVERLPGEYCCIFDTMMREVSEDPVILHMQASRRLKREVGPCAT